MKAKPGLTFLEERVRRGEETNPLVLQFFETAAAQELKAARYHRINNHRRLKKEITETQGIVNALTALLHPDTNPAPLHVIDLCCGKLSLTTTYLALLHPQVVITAVDKISPDLLPHYPRDGSSEMPGGKEGEEGRGSGSGSEPALLKGDRVRYRQLDIMAEDFVSQLGGIVTEVGHPACVLGMHLCGTLSLQAVKAFQGVAEIGTILLSPCCLPSKTTGLPLFATTDQDKQYRAWAHHLQGQLQEGGNTADVTCAYVEEIASPKNALIATQKQEVLCLPCAPQGPSE